MIVRPEHPKKLCMKLREKPLVLYGFGGAGSRIGAWCDENQIEYVYADRAAAEKQRLTEKRVILPELLPTEFSNANVVVTSIVYYKEIADQLQKLGVPGENILSYRLFMPGEVRWKDLEHTTEWGLHEGRVEKIATLLPKDIISLADYGEGKGSLRWQIDSSVKYYPIDYVSRSADTILCDFDKDGLPEIRTEAAVCTSTLVFLEQAERVISHLCRHTEKMIVISYVTTEKFSDTDGRRASGYLSDFSEEGLVNMFLTGGFVLKEKCADPANKIDTIYVFTK